MSQVLKSRSTPAHYSEDLRPKKLRVLNSTSKHFLGAAVNQLISISAIYSRNAFDIFWLIMHLHLGSPRSSSSLLSTASVTWKVTEFCSIKCRVEITELTSEESRPVPVSSLLSLSAYLEGDLRCLHAPGSARPAEKRQVGF